MIHKNLKYLFATFLCASCICFSSQVGQASEYNSENSSFYSEYENAISYSHSDAPVIAETYSDDYSLNENGEAKLTWMPNYYSSNSEITYEVEFSANADLSNAKTYTVSEPSLTLSLADFGENGGRFYARVRYIENGYNYSSWSEISEIIYVKINKTNFPGMYKLLKKGGKQLNFIDGSYISHIYDKNGDGWLDPREIYDISGLYTASVKKTKDGKTYYEPHVKVSSLEGIEYLTNLFSIHLIQYSGTRIDCSNNPRLHNIDVRGITSKKITIISPTANSIQVEATYTNKNFKSINLSKCPNAIQITAYGNDGTPKLTLPKAKTTLKELSVSELGMKTLNLNEYTGLQLLYVYNSDITNVKINKCTDLRYLYFYYCSNIKSLDLSKNKKLIGFSTVTTPGLTEKTVKGYKNADKATFNSKDGKWWYGTEEYQELMQSLWQS